MKCCENVCFCIHDETLNNQISKNRDKANKAILSKFSDDLN